MSSPADLDKSNVVDIDLGSAEFKADAHRHMAEWARRPPFYVLGYGQPQVVVGRYADVHKVFSDTQTFASEMPRGPGWEQFNKIMDAQFVTLFQPLAHLVQEAPGVLLVLEADDKVVGIAHDDHVARGLTPSPALGP